MPYDCVSVFLVKFKQTEKTNLELSIKRSIETLKYGLRKGRKEGDEHAVTLVSLLIYFSQTTQETEHN
jgi:hypothetical protein